MNKRSRLTVRILTLLISLASLLAVFITFSGCFMIYNAGTNGIETELSSVVHTIINLYDEKYPGSYSGSDGVFYKGDSEITGDGFFEICSLIGCSDDVEFTFFDEDVRLYTTIARADGTSAVGTKAADNVTDNVLRGGEESYYSKVIVNGENYIGFYAPIFDGSGKTIGMFFAGKPVETAVKRVVDAIVVFALLAACVLLLLVSICSLSMKKLVAGLADINTYIGKISNGNFEVSLHESTLQRDDEIGEMGANAVKLCGNLKDMIETDTLTGLLNRRTCNIRMNELAESGISYTVAMADIDFFKKVNDGYGHSCGDMVLKGVSAELRNFSELGGGFASRWGGEEFLMVFPDCNVTQTKAVLEDAMNRIRGLEFEYEGKKLSVTITVGISEHFRNDSSDETVNRADARLYHGKQNGRNCIVFE